MSWTERQLLTAGVAGIARSVQELSQVNSNLSWLGAELAGIESGIDALGVGVARVEDAVVAVGEGVAAVGDEVVAVHSSVDRVGDRVDLVTMAVLGLEDRMALKLEHEATILHKQVDLLIEIRDTLRSPMATTAIERVSQAGELLRRQIYDEAFEVAQAAIKSDRTNAAARRAAAWAAMGLNKLDLAHDSSPMRRGSLTAITLARLGGKPRG